MKFEYQTTVVHITPTMIGKSISLTPPGDSWSLLGVTFNGECALYTWAKQVIPETIAKFETSDEEFEVSCKMVSEIDTKIAMANISAASNNEQQDLSNSSVKK